MLLLSRTTPTAAKPTVLEGTDVEVFNVQNSGCERGRCWNGCKRLFGLVSVDMDDNWDNKQLPKVSFGR